MLANQQTQNLVANNAGMPVQYQPPMVAQHAFFYALFPEFGICFLDHAWIDHPCRGFVVILPHT